MARGHPDFLPSLNYSLYPTNWSDFYSTWFGSVSAGSCVEVEVGTVPEKSAIYLTLCHPSCKSPDAPTEFHCIKNTESIRAVYFTGYEYVAPLRYPLFDEGDVVKFKICNHSSADQDYCWAGMGFLITKHTSPPPKIPDCSVLGNKRDYDRIWIGESSLWGKQICYCKEYRIKSMDERIKERIEELRRKGKL